MDNLYRNISSPFKIIALPVICSVAIAFLFSFSLENTASKEKTNNKSALRSDSIAQQVIAMEHDKVIKRADKLLNTPPQTVTAFAKPRSEGGKHDYFSEGPYWWPDKEHPNGPYIQHDGLRNPDRYDHDHDNLSDFSWIVSTETCAYTLTRDEKYVKSAMRQLRAWFIDTATRMNPNLQYAQAIKGICSGRGIGIIDAIPLIDISLSVKILERSPYASKQDIQEIRNWFKQYTIWLTTQPYGIDEMNAKNNHGTWWHAQVVAYAKLLGDDKLLQLCVDFYKNKLISEQMILNGSFPLETARTNSMSYSLFNLDAMASIAWNLSDQSFNVWNYELNDGRGLNKGLDFIYPYLIDKTKWPFKPDISHWELQPSPRQFMLFAALALNSQQWFNVWKAIDNKESKDENIKERHFKNPILFINSNFK
jgi:hypothetical protein